jgi:hypothetical protein
VLNDEEIAREDAKAAEVAARNARGMSREDYEAAKALCTTKREEGSLMMRYIASKDTPAERAEADVLLRKLLSKRTFMMAGTTI